MLFIALGIILAVLLMWAGVKAKLKRRIRLSQVCFVSAAASILVLCVVGSSIKTIGADEVGVVIKKLSLGGKRLPADKYVAVNGETGPQAQILSPGWHFGYWFWQYDVEIEAVTEVLPGQIGVLTAVDGRPLPEGMIYAPEWDDGTKDRMLVAEHFLTSVADGGGGGYQGPQSTVLPPGKYRINPRLFKVNFAKVTNVAVGQVAVVKSNVGDLPDHAANQMLVQRGQRGIWDVPFGPQELYIHPKAYELTFISTLKTVLDYGKREEVGDGKPSTTAHMITVRSVDGFTFPVDVRVQYHIEPINAPMVVATVGDDDKIRNKAVTPNVRAIFRNNAEKEKALNYVNSRSKQEEQAKEMLAKRLFDEYGITVDGLFIGDVGDEASLGALLETQTRREIAFQEEQTFQVEQSAAEQQKALARTRQEALEEERLATATYNVKIAEQKRDELIREAEGNAQKIRLEAAALAEKYMMIAQAFGSGTAAAKLEAVKVAAENGMVLTPHIMMGSGGSSNATDVLMATILGSMTADDSTWSVNPKLQARLKEIADDKEIADNKARREAEELAAASQTDKESD